MRTLFADTVYWVALIYARDHWYDRVQALTKSLEGVRIVTTEEVLVEVLAGLCGSGPTMRKLAVQLVRDLRTNPRVEILSQSPESFDTGLNFYERRLDKSYSLTDCISMHTMRERGITEVLTHDHHFAQEGFVLLLRDGA
jgi:uncharacterized protein